jgi:ribosomal protein S27E
MPGIAAAPDDETARIQDMISEGAPDLLPPAARIVAPAVACPQCGTTKWSATGRCARCGGVQDEQPSAEWRAAQRRAARLVFRVYCMACGRASEVTSPPSRLGRCPACGGTLLTELTA